MLKTCKNIESLFKTENQMREIPVNVSYSLATKIKLFQVQNVSAKSIIKAKHFYQNDRTWPKLLKPNSSR